MVNEKEKRLSGVGWVNLFAPEIYYAQFLYELLIFNLAPNSKRNISMFSWFNP